MGDQEEEGEERKEYVEDKDGGETDMKEIYM